MNKLQLYLIFIYPSYIICLFGVILALLNTFDGIYIPNYVRQVLIVNALWLLIATITEVSMNMIQIKKLNR